MGRNAQGTSKLTTAEHFMHSVPGTNPLSHVLYCDEVRTMVTTVSILGTLLAFIDFKFSCLVRNSLMSKPTPIRSSGAVDDINPALPIKRTIP